VILTGFRTLLGWEAPLHVETGYAPSLRHSVGMHLSVENQRPGAFAFRRNASICCVGACLRNAWQVFVGAYCIRPYGYDGRIRKPTALPWAELSCAFSTRPVSTKAAGSGAHSASTAFQWTTGSPLRFVGTSLPLIGVLLCVIGTLLRVMGRRYLSSGCCCVAPERCYVPLG
jgi:hypothetical protein